MRLWLRLREGHRKFCSRLSSLRLFQENRLSLERARRTRPRPSSPADLQAPARSRTAQPANRPLCPISSCWKRSVRNARASTNPGQRTPVQVPWRAATFIRRANPRVPAVHGHSRVFRASLSAARRPSTTTATTCCRRRTIPRSSSLPAPGRVRGLGALGMQKATCMAKVSRNMAHLVLIRARFRHSNSGYRRPDVQRGTGRSLLQRTGAMLNGPYSTVRNIIDELASKNYLRSMWT